MRLEHATDEMGKSCPHSANGNAETGAKEGGISLVVHRSARGVLSWQFEPGDEIVELIGDKSTNSGQ